MPYREKMRKEWGPTAPFTTIVHYALARCPVLGVGRTKAATTPFATPFAEAMPWVSVSFQMCTHDPLGTVLPLSTLGYLFSIF